MMSINLQKDCMINTLLPKLSIREPKRLKIKKRSNKLTKCRRCLFKENLNQIMEIFRSEQWNNSWRIKSSMNKGDMKIWSQQSWGKRCKKRTYINQKLIRNQFKSLNNQTKTRFKNQRSKKYRKSNSILWNERPKKRCSSPRSIKFPRDYTRVLI